MPFDRREPRAVGLIADLMVWLLPERFPTDSDARPDESRRIV